MSKSLKKSQQIRTIPEFIEESSSDEEVPKIKLKLKKKKSKDKKPVESAPVSPAAPAPAPNDSLEVQKLKDEIKQLRDQFAQLAGAKHAQISFASQMDNALRGKILNF